MSDSPSTPRRRPAPPDGGGARTGAERSGGRSGVPRATTQSVPRRASPGRPRPKAPPREGGAPQLSCTSGPREGESFTLEGADAWVIGRATDVPISVPDTSVSRRHVSVHQRDGRWVVEDLGSGNGTLVNGSAIAAETPLAHGDVLTLGDTEFTFLAGAVTHESTARRPNPLGDGALVPVRRPVGRAELRNRRGRGAPDPAAQAKRKKFLLIGLGVACIALIPLGVIKRGQIKDQERQAAEQAALQVERARFGQLAQEGKSLLRERKWDEARTKFTQLLEISPGHQEAQDYLAVIERETKNQAQLDAARKALDAGKIAEAQAALMGVTNTLMHEDERKLKTELAEKVIARVRDARGIMASPDRSQWPTAKEILMDVLAAYPDDRDASVALGDLQAAMGSPDPNAPRAPKPRAQPRAWDGAVASYMAGDLTRAVSQLQECAPKTPQCRELLEKVNAFASLNRKVDTLDAAGLGRLLQLDREIGDGAQSKLAQAAGLRAANAYYRSASAAMAAAQWSRASQFVQRALKANPQHEESRRFATQLREKAMGIYMEGYILKENAPEQAREKMRQVIEMAPSGDEAHQKAQRLLNSLGG